jgi:hypothetical protein
LVIEERVDLQAQKYGFEIFYVGKQYKSKLYYCSDEKSYKDWHNAL